MMTAMKVLTFFLLLAAVSRVLVDPLAPQLIDASTGFLSGQFRSVIFG